MSDASSPRWPGIAAILTLALGVGPVAGAGRFESDWQGSRTWTGPETWANPLQDWRVDDGEVVGQAARGRTLHLLTHRIGREPGSFETSVTLRLDARGSLAEPAAAWGGFAFAVRGTMDDDRHALIHANQFLQAGIRADGTIFVQDAARSAAIDPRESVTLTLRIAHERDAATAELEARQGAERATVSGPVDASELRGNLALVAESARDRTAAAEADAGAPAWRFRAWTAEGSKLEPTPGRTFGPILWSQYTLSRGVLKLSAQFPPLGVDDERSARLELRRADRWEAVAESPIDPLSRTAPFRVEGWDASEAVAYRVAYRWQGRDHHWDGTIRRDPSGSDSISMAVMSCDNGYAFPLPRLVANVAHQDPDLLFFAGDQIYENYGGFGVGRDAPVGLAMLDYLRKYYQFGWTWRELLRDRPAIIIPDDHDVFQGNLWGADGRPLPGEDFALGGYLMPPEWVDAVHRTQVGHLPDPADPRPDDRIGVYFTDLIYGGLGLAILEDRRFKSGPDELLRGLGRPRASVPPEELDVPGAVLLGDRQEAFLGRWAADWEGARMKVVLSQTLFSKATTHSGRELTRSLIDVDSNAWPQSGRDRALDLIRRGYAFMIHGDQHLGIIAHLGIDDWEDAGVAFMVPGTANGFPRAWWPDQPGDRPRAEQPEWTGRYLDGLGNRLTVLAAGNPDPAIVAGHQPDHPEERAQLRGSGYGRVVFDLAGGTARFELYRYLADVRHPGPDDQFDGWPVVASMLDNGPSPRFTLPEQDLPGADRPIVQVVSQEDGAIVSTVRPPSRRFRPSVPGPGRYLLRILDPGADRPTEIRDLDAVEAAR